MWECSSMVARPSDILRNARNLDFSKCITSHFSKHLGQTRYICELLLACGCYLQPLPRGQSCRIGMDRFQQHHKNILRFNLLNQRVDPFTSMKCHFFSLACPLQLLLSVEKDITFYPNPRIKPLVSASEGARDPTVHSVTICVVC